MLLRVTDSPTLDLGALLRGAVKLGSQTCCTLLCPVRAESLPLTGAELEVVIRVPADHWVRAEDAGLVAESDRLADLAQRGLLLADPAPDSWRDLEQAERAIAEMHWNDVAAVYHAHSRWQGVDAVSAATRAPGPQRHIDQLEKLRRLRGDPPPHFVTRDDAEVRTTLQRPVFDGPFFQTLLARKTTRAFDAQQALPLPALETVLYAVFGTHGMKEFAPRIAALKRTSPSGGALHPIEAYVVAMKVDSVVPGIYHYETATHALARLEQLTEASARDLAAQFTAGQRYFAEAGALVVHVARFDRNFWKYAKHRKAYKAIMMDSGHLSQTFYLTAAYLGLGAFYTAAINDGDIAKRLRLESMRESAIAINGLGIAAAGRDDLHFLPDRYEFPDAAGTEPNQQKA